MAQKSSPILQHKENMHACMHPYTHREKSEVEITLNGNQNSIQEETKSTLKSGIACYHTVQNLLSSSLLSKNVKIRI
jgi:hypothetical protein